MAQLTTTNVYGDLTVMKNVNVNSTITTTGDIYAECDEQVATRTWVGNASVDTAANLTRSISSGNGLSGGGELTTNRTISLGTPSTITESTSNSTTSTSHTHAISLSGSFDIDITGNANTVDNLHASSFLRSNANDTGSGRITLTHAVCNEATLKVIRAIDDGSGTPALIVANDGDGTGDTIAEFRGNSSGANVDDSDAPDSSDAKFRIFGNGLVRAADEIYMHNTDLVATRTWVSNNYLGDGEKAANSDELDGLNSTQFLRSDTSDYTTGNLCVGTTSTNGNRFMRVLSNDSHKAGFEAYGSSQGTGYLYVGQSSTHGGGFEYNGDGTPTTTGAGSDFIALWRRSSGTDYWTARNSHSNNNWEFRGDIIVGGQLIESSDIAFKENIRNLCDNTISNLMKLRPVTYNRTGSTETEYGLIAQELELIYPELVKSDEYKSITYTKLTSILVKSIQEQQKQINELKSISIIYHLKRLVSLIKNKFNKIKQV